MIWSVLHSIDIALWVIIAGSVIYVVFFAIISLFYDKESFNVEMEIGKNYIEQDMGQTIVLYQVDASKTQADAVYGETTPGSVTYKTPVEIPCVYKVEAPELKSYDKDKQKQRYLVSSGGWRQDK